jgi:23S rRNA (adenine2030-N6)-methyltransferase
MLSYRHAFHAGNPGDVIKHSILIHCLRHFLKKEKPFHYIDTHAGAGLYDLTETRADKNREYEAGISRLLDLEQPIPPLLQDYVATVQAFNSTTKLTTYPGSPLIASRWMRPKDQLRLHELHPDDHERLHQCTASDPRVLLQRKDGLRGMIKALPPPSRRALILIDPPYEMKEDYRTLPFAIHEALSRFATATILVWYPMLESGLFKELKADLEKVSGSRWLHAELKVREPGPGLYGSGMWVINPPWELPMAIENAKAPMVQHLTQSPCAELLVRHQIP